MLSLRSSKRELIIFVLLSLSTPIKSPLMSILEYTLVLRKKKPLQPTQTKAMLLSVTDNNPSRAAACPVASLTCAPCSEDLRCVSSWTANFSLSLEFGSIVPFIIHQFYIYLPALRAHRYKIKILIARLYSSELPALKKVQTQLIIHLPRERTITALQCEFRAHFCGLECPRSIHKKMECKA